MKNQILDPILQKYSLNFTVSDIYLKNTLNVSFVEECPPKITVVVNNQVKIGLVVTGRRFYSRSNT